MTDLSNPVKSTCISSSYRDPTTPLIPNDPQDQIELKYQYISPTEILQKITAIIFPATINSFILIKFLQLLVSLLIFLIIFIILLPYNLTALILNKLQPPIQYQTNYVFNLYLQQNNLYSTQIPQTESSKIKTHTPLIFENSPTKKSLPASSQSASDLQSFVDLRRNSTSRLPIPSSILSASSQALIERSSISESSSSSSSDSELQTFVNISPVSGSKKEILADSSSTTSLPKSLSTRSAATLTDSTFASSFVMVSSSSSKSKDAFRSLAQTSSKKASDTVNVTTSSSSGTIMSSTSVTLSNSSPSSSSTQFAGSTTSTPSLSSSTPSLSDNFPSSSSQSTDDLHSFVDLCPNTLASIKSEPIDALLAAQQTRLQKTSSTFSQPTSALSDSPVTSSSAKVVKKAGDTSTALPSSSPSSATQASVDNSTSPHSSRSISSSTSNKERAKSPLVKLKVTAVNTLAVSQIPTNIKQRASFLLFSLLRIRRNTLEFLQSIKYGDLLIQEHKDYPHELPTVYENFIKAEISPLTFFPQNWEKYLFAFPLIKKMDGSNRTLQEFASAYLTLQTDFINIASTLIAHILFYSPTNPKGYEVLSNIHDSFIQTSYETYNINHFWNVEEKTKELTVVVLRGSAYQFTFKMIFIKLEEKQYGFSDIYFPEPVPKEYN